MLINIKDNWGKETVDTNDIKDISDHWHRIKDHCIISFNNKDSQVFTKSRDDMVLYIHKLMELENFKKDFESKLND